MAPLFGHCVREYLSTARPGTSANLPRSELPLPTTEESSRASKTLKFLQVRSTGSHFQGSRSIDMSPPRAVRFATPVRALISSVFQKFISDSPKSEGEFSFHFFFKELVRLLGERRGWRRSSDIASVNIFPLPGPGRPRTCREASCRSRQPRRAPVPPRH